MTAAAQQSSEFIGGCRISPGEDSQGRFPATDLSRGALEGRQNAIVDVADFGAMLAIDLCDSPIEKHHFRFSFWRQRRRRDAGRWLCL